MEECFIKTVFIQSRIHKKFLFIITSFSSTYKETTITDNKVNIRIITLFFISFYSFLTSCKGVTSSKGSSNCFNISFRLFNSYPSKPYSFNDFCCYSLDRLFSHILSSSRMNGQHFEHARNKNHSMSHTIIGSSTLPTAIS